MTRERPIVLLFNPATWRGVGDATAPWGAIGLATYLEPDVEVRFFDQRFDHDWRRRTREALATGRVLFAGATGMTGLQLKGSLAFLRHVRAASPSTPTVFGGTHASMLPHETVAHEAVDYVVAGEGEEVVRELADCFLTGSTPEATPDVSPSIVWPGRTQPVRYAQVADLAALPRPPHERFPMARYVTRTPHGRTLSVLTSRGCPHGCAFCLYSNPQLKGGWRGLPADQTVAFMRDLARACHVEHFHIQDDNFFVRTRRVDAIVESMLDNPPGFTWTVGGAHVTHLKRYDQSFFRAMRRAGCTRLLIGAESGSGRILERIGKRQSVADVLAVNDHLIRADIRPIYSFICGIPGEDDSDLRATVDLMARLRRRSRAVDVGTIKPLVFFPGTRLYHWALENGFQPPATIEGWCGISWDHYLDLPYPWLTPARRRFLIRLYYTSLLWNPHYHWVNSRLFTTVARAAMPLTDYRMRNLDFRAALMPDLLRWLQHRALS